MHMHRILRNLSHCYFIVVAIFFFGSDASMAAARPYLPAETASWPGVNNSLATSVSTIQAQLQDPNIVQWVQYGSPNFSNPGVVAWQPNPTNTVPPKVFGGFQDIDIESGFEEFSAYNSVNTLQINNTRHFAGTQHPIELQQHYHHTSAHANDAQVAEVDAGKSTQVIPEMQAAKLAQKTLPQLTNVWLDLDS